MSDVKSKDGHKSKIPSASSSSSSSASVGYSSLTFGNLRRQRPDRRVFDPAQISTLTMNCDRELVLDTSHHARSRPPNHAMIRMLTAWDRLVLDAKFRACQSKEIASPHPTIAQQEAFLSELNTPQPMFNLNPELNDDEEDGLDPESFLQHTEPVHSTQTANNGEAENGDLKWEEDPGHRNTPIDRVSSSSSSSSASTSDTATAAAPGSQAITNVA